MEPTKQDAEAMLKDAGAIESAVRARAPQEYPLYLAMGLGFVCCGLFFDLGDNDSVGAAVAVAVLTVVLLAVLAGTHVPYLRRYRQVRMRSTPTWVEWALAAWAAAALFSLGALLDGTITFSYTVGGIVGAVPFLLWAERLRRTA
jgi:hypothetical protein